MEFDLLRHVEYSTAIAGLFAILVFFYLIQRRSSSSNNVIPKPPEAAGGWPIIGHLHLLGGSQLPHITLANLADKYGPVFTIRVGVHPTLVVSSCEMAKECFTTYDTAVSTRPKLIGGEILGWNYVSFGFAPYGPYWREIRKITASELLSNIRLEQLRHVRESEIRSFLKDLYKLWSTKRSESDHDDQVLVEMKKWISDISLNVSLRMVVGKRYMGGDEKETRRCQKAMREFFRLTGLFLVGDAIPFLRWLDFGGHEKAMRKIQAEMECLGEEWLDEHKRRRDSVDFKYGEIKDFMEVIMSILESSDLAGHAAETVNKATSLNLITGGTDTTAVTLIWALSLLLKHTSVLKKVQDELDLHVGKERLVNESDISNLVYLQAVVKETLRLYPAGPLSGAREFTEDCTIGGYHVAKGTRLITNLWKIQTDSRIWSDPLEFKPERFLISQKDVDVKGKHFELIPFGAGRRSCPGITYGLQMTYLVLAGLLQGFQVSSHGPVDMTAIFGLTNVKATPLQVLVKPRLSDSSLYG